MLWGYLWSLGIRNIRNFNLLIRAFNLTTRAFNLTTRVFNLAARAFSLLTRGFELVTRRSELVTREFQLLTRRFKLVTCGFELVTRVLLFHDFYHFLKIFICFVISFKILQNFFMMSLSPKRYRQKGTTINI